MFGGGVGGVYSSAGETDLAGVAAEVGAASGQQDALFRARGDRDEDGGFGEVFAVGFAGPGGGGGGGRLDEGVGRVGAGEAGAQTLGVEAGGRQGRVGQTGRSPKGKKTPWLQTPSCLRPPAQPGTARATSS